MKYYTLSRVWFVPPLSDPCTKVQLLTLSWTQVQIWVQVQGTLVGLRFRSNVD